MARLAALVPKPKVNLTRFHGVFAPNSKYRALVTPAKRGKGNKREENCKTGDCASANRHAAMTWAQRLKRVFNIDITTCEECGGAVKVIVSVNDLEQKDRGPLWALSGSCQAGSEGQLSR